jgi:adenylosuccinate synthase
MLPAWKGDIGGARRKDELPDNLLTFLKTIEEFTDRPVSMLSIGPSREQTIVLRPDLCWAN